MPYFHRKATLYLSDFNAILYSGFILKIDSFPFLGLNLRLNELHEQFSYKASIHLDCSFSIDKVSKLNLMHIFQSYINEMGKITKQTNK